MFIQIKKKKILSNSYMVVWDIPTNYELDPQKAYETHNEDTEMVDNT